MRSIINLVFLVLLFTAVTVSAATDQQTEYYISVGDYFNVSYEDVDKLVERGIADEDLPVVFKIAQTAEVDYNNVAEKRLKGSKWMLIASQYNLDASDFYMMINAEIKSKTYVPIFAKFRFTPRQQWAMISFTDKEIVDLVNLKFISSHHDYSFNQIMGMRDYGRNFVKINKGVTVAKAKLVKKQMAQRKLEKSTVQDN